HVDPEATTDGGARAPARARARGRVRRRRQRRPHHLHHRGHHHHGGRGGRRGGRRPGRLRGPLGRVRGRHRPTRPRRRGPRRAHRREGARGHPDGGAPLRGRGRGRPRGLRAQPPGGPRRRHAGHAGGLRDRRPRALPRPQRRGGGAGRGEAGRVPGGAHARGRHLAGDEAGRSTGGLPAIRTRWIGALLAGALALSPTAAASHGFDDVQDEVSTDVDDDAAEATAVTTSPGQPGTPGSSGGGSNEPNCTKRDGTRGYLRYEGLKYTTMKEQREVIRPEEQRPGVYLHVYCDDEWQRFDFFPEVPPAAQIDPVSLAESVRIVPKAPVLRTNPATGRHLVNLEAWF